MNISLTPELEQYIRQNLKSGLYLSASEVVREALRLLQQSEQIRLVRLADLQNKVAVGLKQLDAGDGIDGDEALRSIREQTSQCRKKR